jgi:hypothetical protein
MTIFFAGQKYKTGISNMKKGKKRVNMTLFVPEQKYKMGFHIWKKGKKEHL